MIKIAKKTLTFITKVLHSPLFWILLICACWQFFLYRTYKEPLYTPDTWSYVRQDNNRPGYRTPVYPLITNIVSAIGGAKNCFKNIVRLQKTLFFLSIIFFYLALKKITKKRAIIAIASLLYGCLPSIIVWNLFILTESITIFLTTIIIYLTVSYLTKPNRTRGAIIGLVSLITILTRPAMVFLLPIFFIFWVIKLTILKKTRTAERKSAIIGLSSCIVAILLVLSYCFAMKVQYSHFGLSTVSDINKTWMLVDSGIYKKSTDAEKVMLIKEKEWSAPTKLIATYGYDETAKFVKETIDQNRLDYLKYLAKKVLRKGSESIHAVYSNDALDINKRMDQKSTYLTELSTIMLPINFGVVYLMLAAGIIYLIYQFIKKHVIDWLLAFLISIVFSNLFLSMFMAPFELQRLFAVSLPSLISLIVYWFSKFFFRTKKEVDFSGKITSKK